MLAAYQSSLRKQRKINKQALNSIQLPYVKIASRLGNSSFQTKNKKTRKLEKNNERNKNEFSKVANTQAYIYIYYNMYSFCSILRSKVLKYSETQVVVSTQHMPAYLPIAGWSTNERQSLASYASTVSFLRFTGFQKRMRFS